MNELQEEFKNIYFHRTIFMNDMNNIHKYLIQKINTFRRILHYKK